jgi:hypothetical protein
MFSFVSSNTKRTIAKSTNFLSGPPLFGYLLFQPFNQVVVNKQKLFGNAGQKRVMLKTHM